MGIEEPDTANLNRFIGPPLYESFSRFYQLNPEDTQSAVDAFRVYFKEKECLKINSILESSLCLKN